MDFNNIIQSISTVGFPIVACAVLFYLLEKTNQLHKEEMDKMSETIHNNTIALTKLADKLGGGEKDG